MLAAAEAGGGELPPEFMLPTVHRLDELGARPRLTVTSGEGDGEAIDLGWFGGEPLIGQPRALAGLAARSEGAAIVFATEQGDRVRALLDEAGRSEERRVGKEWRSRWSAEHEEQREIPVWMRELIDQR